MFEIVGEFFFESIGGKILLGVGLILVAPVALPILRPVTKQVIKTGLGLAGKAQEVVAETREKWGDVVAEAQSEMAEASEGQVV